MSSHLSETSKTFDTHSFSFRKNCKNFEKLWTGFLFSISYEPNFCYLVFCSIFSVSQFCLIVIRYSICIYGESRHMLFWIPQYTICMFL